MIRLVLLSLFLLALPACSVDSFAQHRLPATYQPQRTYTGQSIHDLVHVSEEQVDVGLWALIIAKEFGHTDNSFAFMLHARPNLEPASLRYPEDAQSMIVYESFDLDATLKQLDAHGIVRLHDAPHVRPGERFVAFRDPFGNVSEIVERL